MAQHSTQRQISLKEISRDDAFSCMSDELKERVFQDYVDLDLNPLPLNYSYVGCFVGGHLAGFIHLAKSKLYIVDIHININKLFRGYAPIFANKIIDNLFKNSDVNRIESEIPVLYKSMLKFVQNIGFELEGKKQEAFNKNGKWHDTYIIGLTRNNHGRHKLKRL